MDDRRINNIWNKSGCVRMRDGDSVAGVVVLVDLMDHC